MSASADTAAAAARGDVALGAAPSADAAATDAAAAGAPNRRALVEIRGLAKHFGVVAAVNGVDLTIEEGEIFCLLGGSGSGKTTLLRMLAGFEKPTSGAIFLDGVDLTAIEPYARPINMMFQSYALFPHMSVAGNLDFGLRLEQLSRSERMRRIDDALRLVDLEGLGRRRPHQLSGGQRQRVALARALIKRPRLLLLDEPLAALDKNLREQTQLELLRIQRESGATFVIVTHDQEEAMTLADRVGVMRDGRLVQVGDPAEIYERPGSRFVAEFIGSVNLFEGKVAARDAGGVEVALELAGARLRADVGGDVAAAVGASVAVALRPEKISIEPLAADAPATATQTNQLIGVVEELLYLGAQTTYAVLVGDRRILCRRFSDAGRGQRFLEPGQRVALSWSAAAPVLLTA